MEEENDSVSSSSGPPTQSKGSKAISYLRLQRIRIWKAMQWCSYHFPRGLTTGDGIAFASVIVAVFLVVGQCLSSNRAADLQNRQSSMRMAIGILGIRPPQTKDGNPKEFPKHDQILRRWAISVINANAEKGLKIPPKAEEALARGESQTWYGDNYSYKTTDYYGGYDYDVENSVWQDSHIFGGKEGEGFYTQNVLLVVGDQLMMNGKPLEYKGKPLRLKLDAGENNSSGSPPSDQTTPESR